MKAETGKSLSSSSTAQDKEINQIIYDTQQWLSSEYDWPFLRARWDVILPPASRYVAFPTVDDVNLTCAINFERAGELEVYIKWNNIWQEIYYGINEQSEFNYIDSDRGMVLDPVQRWMFDDEGNFEIWPMNATVQTLRFVGQRVLTDLRTTISPLVWNDAATLDLDDIMVTMFVAAEYAMRQKQSEVARDLLTAAQSRMALIRATYPKRNQPPTIVGSGSTLNRRQLRIVPLVVVGGTSTGGSISISGGGGAIGVG